MFAKEFKNSIPTHTYKMLLYKKLDFEPPIKLRLEFGKLMYNDQWFLKRNFWPTVLFLDFQASLIEFLHDMFYSKHFC